LTDKLNKEPAEIFANNRSRHYRARLNNFFGKTSDEI